MNKTENEYQDFLAPAPVNRQYKDRLFRMVFRNKKDLLELYNAMNGTDYQDEEGLFITTLEDVIYFGMKNDVAFMVGTAMNLYEQQSTWSENMPLRGLIYFAGLYQAYVVRNRYNLYGSRKIPLPIPKYVVFYNGTGERPDRTVMKLSDSFMPGRNGQGYCLECEAVILNINQGHNRELLEKCRRLGEYTEFVAKVRQYLRQEVSVEMAIRRTMEECLREGILVDVLTRCKTEVLEVLLTEYNEEETREYLRREAIEEGLEEGLAKGLEEGLAKGLEQGLEEGLAKGLEQGLKLLIETCQELGVSKSDTEVRILDKCKLNEEELHRYMETYWKTNKGE